MTFTLTALESGGQSILNGGFITSLSGSFTAAGNEFQYNVELFTEEYVFTTGPLEEPLTVQVRNSISSCIDLHDDHQ